MSYLNPMHGPAPCGAANVADAVDTPGSMIVAPASFRSSTARMKTCDDLGIGAVALVGEAQHADARALQSVAHAATAA